LVAASTAGRSPASHSNSSQRLNRSSFPNHSLTHQPMFHSTNFKVKVKVILCLAVYRQSVHLGFKRLKVHNQRFSFNFTLAAIVLLDKNWTMENVQKHSCILKAVSSRPRLCVFCLSEGHKKDVERSCTASRLPNCIAGSIFTSWQKKTYG
jgi:hypothetical protein